MKSCSWFIVIQRLDIDKGLIILPKTTIPVVAITTDVVVWLRALAVSDAFGVSHTPDERTKPDKQVSQVELFVLMHFFQFLAAQLVIISFMSFWTGLDTPLTAEFM